jgi:cobyrinic acid a,c-diamide synthase
LSVIAKYRWWEAILARIRVVEQYLDLEKVIAIANQAPPIGWQPASSIKRVSKAYRQPVVGVIKDSAFQFYYPENLEELEKRGARLVTVNALRDKALPSLDALYIGGGFPETHAEQLAANSQLPTASLEGPSKPQSKLDCRFTLNVEALCTWDGA